MQKLPNLWPLKTSSRNRITVPGFASFRFLSKSLNVLAAVHSVFWSALNLTVLSCWSYWFWLMLTLRLRYNLWFLVEDVIQTLNGKLLASKAVKNRHYSSHNNYIWWMKFVWYLALSVYFIEVIVSIMFHKKKVAYEWEPCLRENVHTQ